MAVYTQQIMGLPFSLHVRADRSAGLDRAAARLWATLRRYDEVFSPFRPDSAVSRLRRHEPVPADSGVEVAELLELAHEANTRTGGAFDVYYDGTLEPCGLVKGWAAERAVAHLEPLGVDHYLNAGGDVLLRSADAPWRVGVEHPADPSGLLAVLEVHDGAVATSGIRHRGAHIIDPTTRRAATATVQVTVVGPSLTTADIAATAIAVTGDLSAIDTAWMAGHDVLIVRADGDIAATPGIRRYFAGDQRPPLITHVLPVVAAAPLTDRSPSATSRILERT